MRIKMSKQPPPAPTASAVGPCPTVIKIVGRPGTGSAGASYNFDYCIASGYDIEIFSIVSVYFSLTEQFGSS